MITIDYDTFRERFTEFSALTDSEIESYYEQSCSLISASENTSVLSNCLRENGIYLATAVIAKEYENLTTADTAGGVIGSASEGSVSASYMAIPYKTLAEWDLMATNIQPYGKMLWRILSLSQPDIQTDLSTPVDYYDIYQGI